MDPAGMIVAALTAGAVSALQDTASQTVKDAYAGLRDLLVKKLQDDPKAKAVLRKHSKEPKANSRLLVDALRKNGASEDKKIRLAAKRLATIIENQSEEGKYSVEFHGDVRGIVQGDNAKVTMNFTDLADKLKKKKH